MTHVSKQIIVTDPRGRLLTRTVEQLMDDGHGGTRLVRTTAAARCRGCWRPVADAEQLSGRCMWCGQGPLCTLCIARCGACSRILCARCRRGFVWGRALIAACPACLRSLSRRALRDQIVAERQAAFQAAVQRRRERMAEVAMRLQMLRMGVTSVPPVPPAPPRGQQRAFRR
ncbi:MAG: hypothetical protein AB7N70_35115 [Dehalococcoidia bacterium]